jgi:glycosyltransferase involved in cell wall biosynthesis
VTTRSSGPHGTSASSGRPLRIVFILAGLGAGGAEKIINMLAHHRLARGDRIHIFALTAPDNGSYFPYDGRISVDSFGAGERGWKNLLRIGRRMSRLRRRIRDLDPDLVVSFLTKINVQASFIARTLGVPVIVSERNNFRAQRMSPFWRLASTIGFLCSTCIVMQTEAARAALPFPLRKRSEVIPNPVSNDRFEPGTEADARHVVAVGRLDIQKGFDLLLQAFAIARRRRTDLRLTVFGEGPERASLEAQARTLNIEDAVSFPGVTAVPGAWRSSADIFVLSSRFEGFPNVLAEAMAAGIPSIAFDCDWGPREVIKHRDNGLLVPFEDTVALADSLVELASDGELRQKMSERSMSDTRFSAAAILAQWDTLIGAAIKSADAAQRGRK